MGGARQENRGSGVATQVTYAPTARLTANAGWQSSATTMGGVSGEGTQALRQTTAGVTWLAPGGLSLGASVATDTQRFGNAAPDGSAAITALANTTTTLTAGYQRGERVNTSITVTDTAGHGGPLRAQSLVASASARPSDRLLLTGNAWASRSRADMMDGASTSAINSSLAADYHLAGPWHAEARTMRDSVATGTDTASQHATHSVALAWKPREGVAVRVMSGVGDGADAGVGGQRAALVGLTADIAKPGASLGASVRRVTGSGDGPGQLWQSTASGTDMTLAPSLALPADAGAATALSLRGSVQSGRHELAAQSEWLAAGSSRVVYDVTWRYHTQRTTSLALVARRLEGGGDQISFDGTIRF
jgi:hypothetical protein